MNKKGFGGRKILKIAVTGGAGSGKSSFCRMLAGHGFPVIDLDVLARDVVSPGMPAFQALLADFGPDVVGKDGYLNRAWLRDCMTRNPQVQVRLEALIHPAVYRLMDVEILRYENAGVDAVVVEFPLLFETKRESFFDLVVVVFVPPDVQLARLIQRDGVDRSSAERLVGIQMPLGEKARRADFVFDNSGPPEAMDACIRDWIEKGVFCFPEMKFP